MIKIDVSREQERRKKHFAKLAQRKRDRANGVVTEESEEEDGDVDDDAEAPLAPDEGAQQVVAPVVPAVECDDLAVGEHDHRRDDVIERSCALAAGIACFLAKPFSAEELWAVVGGTADKAA